MRVFVAIGTVVIASVILMAASPSADTAIGFVRSSGEFNVDGSQTRDNATLFNGAVVETSVSASHSTLRDGTRLDLGTASRARVYSDHELLERGTTQVHGASHYQVIASNLQVFSTEPFRVSITQPGRVKVVALDGYAEVKNAKGTLVAMVMPGSPLEFQEAGASAPSHIIGCLQKVGNIYVVRDATTNTVVQVNGTCLEQYAGKSVNITGSVDSSVTPIQGASQVIAVTNITAGTGKGCKVNIPAAADAAGGVASAAGMSAGAKAAIIGGIAVVGILAGLAAAGTFTSSAPPSVSSGAP